MSLRTLAVHYQHVFIQGQWPTCTVLEMSLAVTAWKESEEEGRE